MSLTCQGRPDPPLLLLRPPNSDYCDTGQTLSPGGHPILIQMTGENGWFGTFAVTQVPRMYTRVDKVDQMKLACR